MKQFITRNIIQASGVRLTKKYVVIESDDWGTIRMSGTKAYHQLLRQGYPVDNCPYNRNDGLESNADVADLFGVLQNNKDHTGNPALFTLNNIVGNPDFEAIEKGGFQEYHYELFTETLKKYPEHDRVIAYYQEGLQEKVCQMQFHGREHVNVHRWMEALKQAKPAEMAAFQQGMFSPKIAATIGYGNEYMDALDLDSNDWIPWQKEMLSDGLDHFEALWGFRSKTFIAPCYIWSDELEPVLRQKGVLGLQGLFNQFVPMPSVAKTYRKKYHSNGQRNTLGQRYLVRNAYFEPTLNQGFDWESDCLQRIKTAFFWKQPAIICSHRLNYIGWLNPENKSRNLVRLQNLLRSILKNWPDVVFISSDQLVDIINKRK